jgi:mRNA interferase HigB
MVVRVISNKALVDFAAAHPEADAPLQAWRRIAEAGYFSGFADLKRTFNAVDKVGDYHVFDIGGNKFRLICAVHFNRQMLFVRHVFTHKEYDKWKP